MKDEKILKNEIFFDLCDEFENVEDMRDALRGHLSWGVISEDDYNYILEKWDKWLQEWCKMRAKD